MASRYCRPTDIVTSEASIQILEGTESSDPNYQRASLYDRDPAVPMKFTTTGACRLLFEFGSPQSLDAVFIPQHNLDSGLNVRVQANSIDDWGSPALNVGLTITSKDGDGHVKRPWVNLESVVTGVSSASPSASRSPSASVSPSTPGGSSQSPSASASPSISPGGTYRYWSLYIPAGNSVAPQIGEVILVETLREFVRPLTFGVTRTVVRGYIPALETEYGVKTYYDQNVKQWKYGAMILGTTADLQSMLDLIDACHGPVYPFVFVLDDSIESDGGCFVRCSQDMVTAWTHTKVGGGTYEMPLEFEELSRGLPL